MPAFVSGGSFLLLLLSFSFLLAGGLFFCVFCFGLVVVAAESFFFYAARIRAGKNGDFFCRKGKVDFLSQCYCGRAPWGFAPTSRS